ncbi:hypothetical protein [Bdellovibrio sp. HCB337]|uniref:hypothetical protein n=1 Tax=Bdellovibrio sp. HCB337 TaxID=3394358 RepID=UPI0039A5D7F6
MKHIKYIPFLFAVLATGSASAADVRAPYNEAIMAIVKKMPKGGGYETTSRAFKALKSSITLGEDTLEVAERKARPSFCSSATYVVMTELISQMQKAQQLTLTPDTMKALLVKGEPDGAGVWGRWNANGPGTARFFYELNLGSNFTNIADALPGDFMKAFWTDAIGHKERGHSVIFTGTKQSWSGKQICFWSSNSGSLTQAAGFGEKCLAAKKFRRMLFSRLQTIENLNHIPQRMAPETSTYKDQYLADMLKRASSQKEMCEKVGCQ